MAWNRVNDTGCPCMGCGRREIGCHSKCQEYSGWSKELRARRESEFRQRQSQETISHSAIRKMWRKSRWNNQQAIRRFSGDR